MMGFFKKKMDIEKQIEDSKEAVAKEAQSHWTYPMAIDLLLKEKYDKNSTDPNSFSYIIFIDKIPHQINFSAIFIN